ncbi:reticulocalbin-2 isoform X2 [Ascaphus truei]|uniref:reticulocalbin-2 isoform X2 n=1 Tax=Ascaphus truei TaxID=8439 RepID=UPI003F59BEB9
MNSQTWLVISGLFLNKCTAVTAIPSVMKMHTVVVFFSLCLMFCAAHKHHSHQLDSEDHYENGEHNEDYDREAFLGGEEGAEEFTNLSPDEQMKRLKSIINKIDTNSDGYLTEEELSSWIQQSFKHYTLEETKQQFVEYDKDGNGIVSWDEYNIHMYDRVIEYDENTILEDEEEESFRLIHLKDKKRFDHADRDGVLGLNLTEFTDFEHPEEADYMSDYVIEGALEEHDKDGDGFVSLEEYLGDYTKDPGANEDPEWLVVEKDRFSNDYDKDGDGKLGPQELLSWIVPNNQGIAQEEAIHLIEEIDQNGDNRLSKAEILENQDLFLTSEATDYGRQLQDEHFYHDEL